MFLCVNAFGCPCMGVCDRTVLARNLIMGIKMGGIFNLFTNEKSRVDGSSGQGSIGVSVSPLTTVLCNHAVPVLCQPLFRGRLEGKGASSNNSRRELLVLLLELAYTISI